MRRREKLLDSLERELIEPEVFSERYGKIRDLLDQNRAMQAELQTFTDNLDARQAALEASFEAVASFGRNWDLLDHDGRVSLLQTMVKQITVTEEDMHIEVFADSPGLTGVEELSRTGSHSQRRFAICAAGTCALDRGSRERQMLARLVRACGPCPGWQARRQA